MRYHKDDHICDRPACPTCDPSGEFLRGVASVTIIRCVGHRGIGPYNRAEAADGECAACAVVPLEAKLAEARAGIRINDRCPSCGEATLFVSPTGWLTCSWLACKSPCLGRTLDAAERSRLAERRAIAEALRVEDYDTLASRVEAGEFGR